MQSKRIYFYIQTGVNQDNAVKLNKQRRLIYSR